MTAGMLHRAPTTMDKCFSDVESPTIFQGRTIIQAAWLVHALHKVGASDATSVKILIPFRQVGDVGVHVGWTDNGIVQGCQEP